MPAQSSRAADLTPEPRYELGELVDKSHLGQLIESFAKAVGLAAGVVRNPLPGGSYPADQEGCAAWRYTDVIGFDKSMSRILGGSEFCDAIRRLEKGCEVCMKADLLFAHEAYVRHAVVPYYCDPACLMDFVGPITVGGHHLANVYLGQLRGITVIKGEKSSFDEAWKRYENLLSQSANATTAGVNRAELQRRYQQLPDEPSTIKIEIIQELLQRLAELISQRAARQAALKAISEMCAEIGPSFDLASGMSTIMRKVSRILRFSSGSILLADQDYLRPVAAIYPAGLGEQVHLHVDSPDGVVPRIYRDREHKTLRFGTRADMDAFSPSAIAGSRSVRRIQSFLGSPLLVDGEAVGVIEVGLDQENAYTEDDESLIRTVAQYAAMYWKSSREHRTLVSIISENNLDKLLESLVKSVPELVHGRMCSIFLRDMSRWGVTLAASSDPDLKSKRDEFHTLPAFLRATTEFPIVGTKSYSPLQGLTGWVLATGRSLRIDGGIGARTTNLPHKDPPINWLGKYPHEDKTKPKEYYTDRPFLAVPILAHGTVVGVLRLPDSTRGAFSAEDQEVLERFAAAISTAIEATELSGGMRNMAQEIGQMRGVLVASLKAGASRQALAAETLSHLILSRALAVFGGGALVAALGALTSGAGVVWTITCLCIAVLAGLLAAFWWKK